MTAGGVEPVDELQQHAVVTRVGGVRGDETAGDPDQAEQTSVLVVQVDQLDHRVGSFAGGVLELAEFSFEPGRL